jgi:2-methylcitrate dehydratase PrpD
LHELRAAPYDTIGRDILTVPVRSHCDRRTLDEDAVKSSRRKKPTEKRGSALTRRRILPDAGGWIAAAAFPANGATVSGLGQNPPGPSSRDVPDLRGRLARYIVEARDRSLPPNVAMACTHRILDALAAMVSGARLKPGETAIRSIRDQGGVPEAAVLTTDIRTSAVNAALANGMLGTADETDDFDPLTKAHPGCSVVAASLAMAKREGRSGVELLRAVPLGYDLACRFLLALRPNLMRVRHRGVEGMSATFGSAAAAASLARLDETGMRDALSYAAQQVSGLWSWIQDTEHIEKTFDSGGMGARSGVTAALMVQTGFTGVGDVMGGEHNVLEALSSQPQPEQMVAGPGDRFFLTDTAIKTFPVGYPIQAPLDAFLKLRREYGLTVSNVQRIVVKLPADGARIIDNSAMPDVTCQYLIALALMDGAVSFANSDSYESHGGPANPRCEAPRSRLVEVTLRDGRTVSHFTRYPPGSKENPLDAKSLEAKARELMAPVLGIDRTEAGSAA